VSRKVERGQTGRRDSALSFFKGLQGLAGDPVMKEVVSVAGDTEVYLVGGALRNLALGVPAAPDYDFAVKDDIAAFAAEVAARLGGAHFALDAEAGVFRVVLKDGAKVTLDFTPLSPGGIDEDLGKRDFTVNAMAIPARSLFSPGSLPIDPFGGIEDARRRVIKAVSETVFDEDPLRMLRAVRLSRQYYLDITPDTFSLIKKKAGLIGKSSPERIRDEITELFLANGTAEGIELLYGTGLVNEILPEISGWASVQGYDLLRHTLATLKEAESLLAGLSQYTFPGFSERLREYFQRSEGQLSNLCIFKLAAFFHDFGKPYAISREEGRLTFIGHDTKGAEGIKGLFQRLRFSRKTVNDLSFFIKNHHRVFMLAALKERSFRAKGHYFRASGSSGGLMLLCLALADARATRGSEDAELYSVVLDMMSFYYGVYTKKKPKPLLTGQEIMDTFGVAEGPLVGEIIGELNSRVEQGLIRTKREAKSHIRKWLKERDL